MKIILNKIKLNHSFFIFVLYFIEKSTSHIFILLIPCIIFIALPVRFYKFWYISMIWIFLSIFFGWSNMILVSIGILNCRIIYSILIPSIIILVFEYKLLQGVFSVALFIDYLRLLNHYLFIGSSWSCVYV